MANDKHNRDHEIDVRTEMRIALFWRALIGDFEYIKFDPEDLLRWYEALELRGPDEIRDLLTERYSTRPMPCILSVVSRAPHPPVWIVREWLQYHEQKVPKGSYVWAAVGFPLACLLVIPFMHGCVALQPLNPLVMHPPQTNPLVANVGGPPIYGASPPVTPTPTFQPSATATGPQSSGIAGGIAGASPAAGVTGPTNSGASGGLNNSSGAGH
jgi:hypothetical protein